MRALAVAALALAACAGSSSHASAPAALDCQPSTETGSLRGVMTDAKTHATMNTSVTVKSACAPASPRYAITDEHGAYFFADLPVDTYDIFVAGAASVTPARIRIDGGAEMHINVDVTR